MTWHYCLYYCFLLKLKLELFCFENTPPHPMITDTIDLYRIPFIPCQLNQPLPRYRRSKWLTRSLCTYSKRYSNYFIWHTLSLRLFAYWKWNDCGQYCGSYRVDMNPSTDRRMDKQQEGQKDKVKPIYTPPFPLPPTHPPQQLHREKGNNNMFFFLNLTEKYMPKIAHNKIL